MLFEIELNPNDIVSTLCLLPHSMHAFNVLLFACMVELERVKRAGVITKATCRFPSCKMLIVYLIMIILIRALFNVMMMCCNIHNDKDHQFFPIAKHKL